MTPITTPLAPEGITRPAPVPAGVPALRPAAVVLVAAAALAPLALGGAAAVAPGVAVAAVILLCSAALVLARPELLLLALVTSLPWESKLAYPSPTVTVVAFTRVALPVLLLLRIFVRRDRLIVPRFLAPLGVFLLLTLLSLMLSPEPGEGLVKTVRYLIFATSLFVAIQLLGDRGTLLRAIRLLAISAAAASIYALVGFLDGQLTRAAGPVADPNDFGDLIATVIPLAVFLFLEDRKWRVLWGLVLTALLSATLGSLSRGALVGLGGLLVWGILTRRVSAVALLGATTLLATILVLAFAFFGSVLGERISGRERITSSTAAARIVFWEAAASMSTHHPLLGVGPERFDAERERYLRGTPVALESRISTSSQTRELIRSVHNSYLEIAAENGIPAALAFCAFLLAVWGSLRNFSAQAGRYDDQGKRLAAALVGALITTVLACFFVSGELEASFWLVAAFAGALTGGWLNRPPSRSRIAGAALPMPVSGSVAPSRA
jgi:putative inorganic carbon (HCO3(-)) transporter